MEQEEGLSIAGDDQLGEVIEKIIERKSDSFAFLFRALEQKKDYVIKLSKKEDSTEVVTREDKKQGEEL